MELLHEIKSGDSMTSDIIAAIVKECHQILKKNQGTIIFKTDYKSDNIGSYAMPLIIVDIQDGQDSGQVIGGVTKMEWLISLNTYYYSESGSNDIDSFALQFPIDKIRKHFTIGKWKTKEMTQIRKDYGFKFALSSITQPDALDEDGMIKGYRINLDSIAFDLSTSGIQETKQTLQGVVKKTV